MRYDAILIDADDTLLDFKSAEANAIRQTLCHLGIADADAAGRYHKINKACWLDFEKGLITQAQLKRRRFETLLTYYGRRDDPGEAAAYYEEALSHQGMLLPGALDAVAAIARVLPVAVITNGIARVQHGRLDASPLIKYVRALIISQEQGCQKPDRRMIEAGLCALGGVDPRRALMVGDSLTSDIRCANNAGVDACWYNPDRLPRPDGYDIAWEIRQLEELPNIALA